ncbi:PadR family transcriptional regulator [Sphingomonas ginsenosidivorax]|nr:PadR family transcriptional regulator [Sphingomonas ginsenosidivorax]
MFNTHNRGCGPRGGHFERGPFSMSWEVRGGERHNGRHEHGRGFGGGGFGGGGGRRRMFDGGELKLVLLKLIADTPRHGYDLIREIEAMTGGSYAPSPGVVYPTLTLLDEMNLVAEQQSEGAKKRFAVTDEGQALLAGQAELVEALFARLAALNAESERTDRAPIRRAMGNLRHVVQDRLLAGGFSDDAVHQVAALIDEVVQKIERLK